MNKKDRHTFHLPKAIPFILCLVLLFRCAVHPVGEDFLHVRADTETAAEAAEEEMAQEKPELAAEDEEPYEADEVRNGQVAEDTDDTKSADAPENIRRPEHAEDTEAAEETEAVIDAGGEENTVKEDANKIIEGGASEEIENPYSADEAWDVQDEADIRPEEVTQEKETSEETAAVAPETEEAGQAEETEETEKTAETEEAEEPEETEETEGAEETEAAEPVDFGAEIVVVAEAEDLLEEKETPSYTFSINGEPYSGMGVSKNLVKVASDSTEQIYEWRSTDPPDTPLAGAHFVLYRANGEELGESTTDEDGLPYFEKLDAGTYYLVEEKAPEGYETDREKINVVISAQLDGEGVLQSYSISINGITSTYTAVYDSTGKVIRVEADVHEAHVANPPQGTLRIFKRIPAGQTSEDQDFLFDVFFQDLKQDTRITYKYYRITGYSEEPGPDGLESLPVVEESDLDPWDMPNTEKELQIDYTGGTASVELSVPSGWMVQFSNLPVGSSYQVREHFDEAAAQRHGISWSDAWLPSYRIFNATEKGEVETEPWVTDPEWNRLPGAVSAEESDEFSQYETFTAFTQTVQVGEETCVEYLNTKTDTPLEPLQMLPSTAGRGSYLFFALGILMMLLAPLLLFCRSRQDTG